MNEAAVVAATNAHILDLQCDGRSKTINSEVKEYISSGEESCAVLMRWSGAVLMIALLGVTLP